MSGVWLRMRIWLKLWLTTVHSISIMLLVPISIYLVFTIEAGDIRSFSSLVYEQATVIWFVFVLQWSFSIDFNSNFHVQLITYRLSRVHIILERLLFSYFIFYSTLILLTIVFKIWGFNFSWYSLVFTIPVHASIGGVVLFGTVMGNHSLGGLFGGLISGLFLIVGGELLGNLNPILLKFQNVYKYVVETGMAETNSGWITTNRFFYLLLGVLLIVLALVQFNKKTF
ncbi:hypothetical protein [Sporosarcina limicola]|uniref:Uncharacterized protein n=1 Tax=Sporosarcina limicola TaxID=34101 RepID=A0A927R5J3_9BACL|nr:hypothetical protein [Sporosarcina limicola]MBE1556113.1 hypothetical protein [Sporosarcina limicola]